MNVTTTVPIISPATEAPKRPATTGETSPPAGNNSPPPPQPVDVQKAVMQIESFLADSQRQLDFKFHEASGRTVITVLNPETGETIRQIPAEEVLAIAAALDTEGLHLISQKA